MYRITAIVILSVVAFGAFVVDSPAQVRYTFPSAQVEVGPPGIRIQTPFWSGYFPAPPIRPPFPFPFRRGRVIISPAPTVVQPRVVTPAPETPPVVVPDKKQ